MKLYKLLREFHQIYKFGALWDEYLKYYEILNVIIIGGNKSSMMNQLGFEIEDQGHDHSE